MASEASAWVRGLMVKLHFPVWLGATILIPISTGVFAKGIPNGYTVPDMTLSADHRYGVTVPNADLDETTQPLENSIVETTTGRLVGAIQGDAVYERMNHQMLVPTLWSADDSELLWQSDEKWGFGTEILITLKDGKVKSQVDVLKSIRQEILKRTQEAAPDNYALVKAGGAGNGSWWQDGFAIDSVLDGQAATLTFPLIFHVFLSANPKGNEGQTNVDSRMTVEVTEDGKLKVDEFHLGTQPPSRNWD